MKNIAKAVIHSFQFFELCDDDVLDPDTALQMAESILADLDGCSEDELAALMEVVKEELETEKANLNRKTVVEFLTNFDRDILPNF